MRLSTRSGDPWSDTEGRTEPLGLARTLLLLGAIERRRLHKRAARETLGAALAPVRGPRRQALGSRPLGRSSRRIGGRVASPDALTPSERARRHARRRRSNEPRGRNRSLVLAERTVEGHLSKIYAKLGVRSRAELAHQLTGATRTRGIVRGRSEASSGGTYVSRAVDPRLRSWHAAHRAASARTAGRNLRCLQGRSSPSTGVFASRSSRSCSRRRFSSGPLQGRPSRPSSAEPATQFPASPIRPRSSRDPTGDMSSAAYAALHPTITTTRGDMSSAAYAALHPTITTTRSDMSSAAYAALHPTITTTRGDMSSAAYEARGGSRPGSGAATAAASRSSQGCQPSTTALSGTRPPARQPAARWIRRPAIPQ